MTEITTLTPAKTESKSLRTTVPISVVRLFNLGEGDKLSWDMEPRGKEIVVVVRPNREEAPPRKPQRKKEGAP